MGSDLGLEGTHFPFRAPREFLSFCPSRRAKPKILDHIGIVVVFLTLLVDPIVGANLSLKDELITLARIFSDCFSEALERHEP